MLAAVTEPPSPRELLDLASGTPDDLGLPGTVVDQRYLVERVVGAGGFGVVFRARHVRFDSPVALKVLIRGHEPECGALDGMDESPVEGRLLSKLAPLHPAFVHVYEEGVVRCRARGMRPYLVMEWLDGITLRVVLEQLEAQRRALALDTVLHLFDGLAQGLSVAHARRVAHRDLKPGNVFLAVTDGRIALKLLDFGLAKQGSSASDLHDDTAHSSCPFTPAYGAPEQWDRSFGATGPWTDVFALALILVELLKGGRWNAGVGRSDMIRATFDPERRPTPGAFGVNVSGPSEAVFERALAVQPRDRYPNVAEFWGELCKYAGWKHPGTPVDASSLGLTEPMPCGPAAVDAAPAPPMTDAPAVPAGAADPVRMDEQLVGAARGPSRQSKACRAPDRRSRRWQGTIAVLVLLTSASLTGLAALGSDAPRGPAPTTDGRASPPRAPRGVARPSAAQRQERPPTRRPGALPGQSSKNARQSAAAERADGAPTPRSRPQGVALGAPGLPTGTSAAATAPIETRAAGARISNAAVSAEAVRAAADAATGIALEDPMLTRK